jgi:rRNA maturation protein Nop10
MNKSIRDYIQKNYSEAAAPVAKNVKVWTVSAQCPACGGDLTQDGSLNIDITNSTPLKCNECGKEAVLPAKFR